MSLLKFVTDPRAGLKAEAKSGRYLIIDFGREGFDATFTSTSGEEVAVPPLKGGRFHAASRHAILACQEHHRRLVEAVT